jgi:signal transduction histidine kinase
VAPDLPLVLGDSKRITQCLMNLAGNALKFTSEGQVEIRVEGRGDLLLFAVADTGIGIPADQIKNIFEEFRQADATVSRDYGGTGLGLAITRKLVELHGGRIWAESEPGKGSTFFFSIPARIGEAAAA